MLKRLVLVVVPISALCCGESAAGEHTTPRGEPWPYHVIDDSSRGADGVKLADLNGDGLMDIATGWEEGGVTVVYLHPGFARAKSKWPAVTVGQTPSVEDAVFADLDGDGALDVVSCCEGATRKIFAHWAPKDRREILTQDTWEQAPFPEPPGGAQEWLFAWPMQVDGKNGVDLVAGSKGDGASVGWFQAPQNGRDLAAYRWHPMSRAGWTMSIWKRDMDGDGDLDIVVSDRFGELRGCRWLENPGALPAQTQPWRSRFMGAQGEEVLSMALADLDRDGLEDAVVAVKDKRILFLKRLDTAGLRWQTHEISADFDTGNTRAVVVADVNSDGRDDLVFTTWNSQGKHGVLWMEYQRSPTDRDWMPYPISGKEKGIKYDRIEMLDMDGDGDLDLLTCEEREGGHGMGVFWYENPIDQGPNPSAVANEPSAPRDRLLLDDDFSGLKPGQFSSVVGAHTEYHYLPASAPKGGWSVSSFTSRIGFQRAWKVFAVDGDATLAQTFDNVKTKHAHPFVVSGDPAWRDYTLTVDLVPESKRARSGVVFRYRNDRCYYFFGVHGDEAVLKLVQHGTAFRKPLERQLASRPFDWNPGARLTARVRLEGKTIHAEFEAGPTLMARDATFPTGGIGLLADVPTRYHRVSVAVDAAEERRIVSTISQRVRELSTLQAAHPKPVLWKKFKTEGFGVGRNLRFGDLDGDGRLDLLIGQVIHHGPKDRNSEVGCLTAMTFDGERLWQLGEPDPWKDHLTNDVGFQIHDLDGDGATEVIYCKNMEIVVAEGATGKTKYKAPTPETPPYTKPPYNKFPRILGDALLFCDLRGTGHPRDIIIKDRYRSFWALDDMLRVLWSGSCNTGHYPFPYDLDGDGRDEVSIGYSLFDDDGKLLWTLDDRLEDHADGVAWVHYGKDHAEPRLMCAASDEGMAFADPRGNLIKHHHIGHVQNPAVADFRPDLPGLETVSINYWGNQGIIHFFDADGEIYHDVEPCQHGSMCLPINWTGKPGELFVLSPSVVEGGLLDGWGRRAVLFPNDGHPELCNAVMDLTGDCRDEIVVWDASEVWVYTQSDNPLPGRLYKPVRNPLYNYSNYQATVSLPGWSE